MVFGVSDFFPYRPAFIRGQCDLGVSKKWSLHIEGSLLIT